MHTFNWIKKLPLAVAGATFMSLVNLGASQAAILVTNNVMKPPAGKEIPDVGICPPWCGNGVTIDLFTDSSPVTAINNTPFNVVGVIDIIPDDEDAIWDSAFSDIFSSLVISSDRKKLFQSGGVIRPGETVYPFRTTNPPGSRVRFTAQLIFASVPESNSVFGLLVFALLGGAAIVKWKRN
jgi:hypothetical protein